jgi:hypothetical protein
VSGQANDAKWKAKKLKPFNINVCSRLLTSSSIAAEFETLLETRASAAAASADSLNKQQAAANLTQFPESQGVLDQSASQVDDAGSAGKDPTAGDTCMDPLPPPHCPTEFYDFWTFLGGLFLGVGATVVGQVCVAFCKARKRAVYNEPFRFDTFVNP